MNRFIQQVSKIDLEISGNSILKIKMFPLWEGGQTGNLAYRYFHILITSDFRCHDNNNSTLLHGDYFSFDDVAIDVIGESDCDVTWGITKTGSVDGDRESPVGCTR